jgi:hypothetical protein
MAIAFNGTTKRILITSPTALVSVKDDIYSAWKEWVLESDNSKYQPALRSIGGDPVGSGLYAGDIYFLINNWQIELDTIIKVTGTLYHDDGLDPFIVNPGGGVTATVSNLAYAYNTTGVIVPTAVEIRTEMDVNSARLAAIQAKTDTIVDPWLAQLADYIIAGTAGKIVNDIKTQTDTIPALTTAVNNIPVAVRTEMDTNSVKLSQIQAGIAELANANVTISLESITSLVTNIWNANIMLYTDTTQAGGRLAVTQSDSANIKQVADTILAVSI